MRLTSNLDAVSIFSLLLSAEYRYAVEVKACKHMRSSQAVVLFCSESTCNSTHGSVETFNLTVDTGNNWAKTEAQLGFNPVSLRFEAPNDNW